MVFAYDALSRTTNVTNEDGTQTANVYDAKGNRLSVTYPDGLLVSYVYDANGNVTSLTDHDGTGISYTRDAEGRVTKESFTDGSTTEYAYNTAGQLTTITEVTSSNSTRRKISYVYDDNGNLKNELRSGVDIDKRDESVTYYYDAVNQLVRTVIDGKAATYTYDLAGNMLSDGTATYTYDTQNRLLTKTDAGGTTNYTYDNAGNLISESTPGGSVTYSYDAQNRLVLGARSDGQSSAYEYNALGVRTKNVQVRENVNAGYRNADLVDGSHGTDYLDYLSDDRATKQPAWETEVGTTVQNNFETVTKAYVVDYLSLAYRDILVTEDGGFTQRYVYDANGTRISAEYGYADGTERGTKNTANEYGENLRSDIAVQKVGKVWFRTSMLGSTLFVVDANGETVSHTIYDAWGEPLTETYIDANYSGLDNANNFTGYTYDEVLDLYYAQNRFYNAATHRFTQEDIVKDGGNWYVYCGNNPGVWIDPWGSATMNTMMSDGGGGNSKAPSSPKPIPTPIIAKPKTVQTTPQNPLLMHPIERIKQPQLFPYPITQNSATTKATSPFPQMQCTGTTTRKSTDWNKVLTVGGIVLGSIALIAATVVTAGGAGAAAGFFATYLGASATTVAAVETSVTIGGYVIATGVGAYAVSDSVEVISEGYNPIRDSVLNGNQQAYDLTKMIFYFSALSSITAASYAPSTGSSNSSTGNTYSGSTGRTTPNNLNEQLAMEQVKSAPLAGASQLPLQIGDPRWPATDGWVKMQNIVETSQGNINIHFNYNTITGAMADFKFK